MVVLKRDAKANEISLDVELLKNNGCYTSENDFTLEGATANLVCKKGEKVVCLSGLKVASNKIAIDADALAKLVDDNYKVIICLTDTSEKEATAIIDVYISTEEVEEEEEAPEITSATFVAVDEAIKTTTVEVGTTVGNITVEGGTKPYTASITGTDLEVSVSDSTVAVKAKTQLTEQTYTESATITDAKQKQKVASVSFEVKNEE